LYTLFRFVPIFVAELRFPERRMDKYPGVALYMPYNI